MDAILNGESVSPTIAGHSDDPDAAVLDSLVESQAEPDQFKKGVPLTKLAQVAPMSRLMTGTVFVQANWGPVQILPADSRRTALTIIVTSATAADYIRVADDAGKVQFVSSSVLVGAGKDLVLPAAHTGPVWVSAADSVAAFVSVTFVAVTK